MARTKEIYAVTSDKEAIAQLRLLVTDCVQPAIDDVCNQKLFYCFQPWGAFHPCIRISKRGSQNQQAEFVGPPKAFDAMIPLPWTYHVREAL